jgi:hypothetical protein
MRNEDPGRRNRRIDVNQEVFLVTDDGDAFLVTVKDLSRDGFKIGHQGLDLLVGEIVTIRTARSEAKAQIKWRTSDQAGGMFIDEPLPKG